MNLPHWQKDPLVRSISDTSFQKDYKRWSETDANKILNILCGSTKYEDLYFNYRMTRHQTVSVRGKMPRLMYNNNRKGENALYLVLRVKRLDKYRFKNTVMFFKVSRMRDFPFALPAARFKK